MKYVDPSKRVGRRDRRRYREAIAAHKKVWIQGVLRDLPVRTHGIEKRVVDVFYENADLVHLALREGYMVIDREGIVVIAEGHDPMELKAALIAARIMRESDL